MADGVIAIPFRLTPQGEVATAPHGSPQEVDEAIVALALTRVGERPMQPSYGTPDPVFTGLSAGDLQVGLDEFGP
ncbi:hypothetical protein ACMX2H_17445, partial [Arthrobacter sulfonylureivorans]|uniref:hypothetical protein n=1 Tax=Arthrobacter sulfonylureivorans TaxID=2486855 RepID=UPI0039E32BD8